MRGLLAYYTRAADTLNTVKKIVRKQCTCPKTGSNVCVKVEGPSKGTCQLKKALQGFVNSGSNVRVEVEGPSKGGLSAQKRPSRV